MIYRIGEVAKRLNISKAMIYKWEKEGFIKPFKSKTMHRRFDDEHVEKTKSLLGIKA